MKVFWKKLFISSCLSLALGVPAFALDGEAKPAEYGNWKRPFSSSQSYDEKSRNGIFHTDLGHRTAQPFNLSEALKDLNSSSLGKTKKNMVINEICEQILSSDQLKNINSHKLFPRLHKDYIISKFIPTQELLAFMIVEGINDRPLPPRFTMEINRRADQGDILAGYILGCMYMQGKGIAKDEARAMDWFFYTAEHGNKFAQYVVGYCYMKGNDTIQRDEILAHDWLFYVANQGYAKAQASLGHLYLSGSSDVYNENEGIKWYTQAAEQGYVAAQHALGTMYFGGYGVSTNREEGMKWLMWAATQGHKGAQYKLGRIYMSGDFQPFHKDGVKAVKWYTKAAEQGSQHAAYDLGMMYEDGRGVNKNLAKAVEWYLKAAEEGNTDAQQKLKEIFKVNGNNIPKKSSLSTEEVRQIKDLKQKLKRLGENYSAKGAQAKRSSYDARMQPNLFLGHKFDTLASLCANYMAVLDYIEKPQFLLSPLALSNRNSHAWLALLSEKEGKPISSLRDPNLFLCLSGNEIFEKIEKNHLYENVQKLYEMHSLILSIRHNYGSNSERLKLHFEKLKEHNPETFSYLNYLLNPFMGAHGTIKISEDQLENITKHLEEVEKSLSEDVRYITMLSNSVFKLLVNTKSYHNSLLEKTYPWLFK